MYNLPVCIGKQVAPFEVFSRNPLESNLLDLKNSRLKFWLRAKAG